jgi:hypothetical protein
VTLRAFLSLLEAHGGGEAPAGELARVLAKDGAHVRAALVAEGVLRAAPLASTVPCDGVGCALEVRERPRDAAGGRRFVAVCTRAPRECESVDVPEVDLAQERIATDAFVAAVRRAFRVEPPRAASAPRLGGLDEPVLLGEQVRRGVARDVFLAWRPAAAAVRALLAERALAPRPTLVLVLTGQMLDPRLAARAASGGRIAVEVLADRLAARDGRLVEAVGLRIVRGPVAAPDEDATAPDLEGEEPPAARPARGGPVLEHLPRASRWGEVTIFAVDERTVGVIIDRRHRRFGFADLGLSHVQRAVPVQAFELLVAICETNGDFTTAAFGTPENGKRLVSVLRKKLCAAFGIAESPFDRYSRSQKRWRPRFLALSAAPASMRSAEGAPERPSIKRK